MENINNNIFLDKIEKSGCYVKNGGKPDFKTYGTTECRKSLCWTNKTRKAINYKWMQEESRGVDYIIVNNIKVFVGLPVICKTTMSLKRSNKVEELNVDWNQELKNNEEFEVIDIKNKKILIKNDRLQIELSYQNFKHFDLAYCITTHTSQGSTYDFPYSIYEYQYFDQALLYTSMSRSTKKSYINLIDYKPQVSIGYIYKITDIKGKIYIGSTNNYNKDGNNMRKQARICHYIERLKIKELRTFHLKLLKQLKVLIFNNL